MNRHAVRVAMSLQTNLCKMYKNEWNALQNEKGNGEGNDPILDKNGPFKIERKNVKSPSGRYTTYRNQLYQNHYKPTLIYFSKLDELLKKCLDFSRKMLKTNKNPMSLIETATLAVPKESLKNNAPPQLQNMLRICEAPANFQKTDTKIWEKVLYILKNSSYPWLIAGGAATCLWLGVTNYSDVDLFTIVPLTDSEMWIKAIVAELKWLISGTCESTEMNKYFAQTPTLKILKNEGVIRKCYTSYEGNINIAAVYRFYPGEKDEKTIDFVFVVDDRPRWKTMEKQDEDWSPSEMPKEEEGLFLQFPVRYLTDEIDPAHLGFRQNRTALIDFAVNDDLLNTLQNPYRHLARIVECFDLECCKSGAWLTPDNKLMTIFLGQSEFIHLKNNCKMDRMDNYLKLYCTAWRFAVQETISWSDILQSYCEYHEIDLKPQTNSMINACSLFDDIAVVSERELWNTIEKRLWRVEKYNKKFNETQIAKLNHASKLKLNYVWNLMK